MKRGTRWPVAVGLILGSCVAANVWILRIANADPSFAVEADYYQNALRWDDELAQRERNRALGWEITPTLSSISPDSGAELRVSLRDRTAAPYSRLIRLPSAPHRTGRRRARYASPAP